MAQRYSVLPSELLNATLLDWRINLACVDAGLNLERRELEKAKRGKRH